MRNVLVILILLNFQPILAKLNPTGTQVENHQKASCRPLNSPKDISDLKPLKDCVLLTRKELIQLIDDSRVHFSLDLDAGTVDFYSPIKPLPATPETISADNEEDPPESDDQNDLPQHEDEYHDSFSEHQENINSADSNKRFTFSNVLFQSPFLRIRCSVSSFSQSGAYSTIQELDQIFGETICHLIFPF